MAQLTLLDKAQPFLLILSVLLGLLLYNVFPSLVDVSISIVQVGIFILIVLIMSGKSLSEISKGFTGGKKVIFISILINFVFTPFFAWFIAKTLLVGEPEVAAGYILYLVTPCIGWYLIFTELAGGDVETGIVLLGVNIILQLSLLPIYAYLFLSVLIPFNFTDLIKSIIIYLIIPLGLSRIVRRVIQSTNTPKLSKTIDYSKTILLMIVIIFMFLSQSEKLYSNIHVLLIVFIPVLIFFLLIPLVDLAVAKTVRITYKQYALLTFTTTARNSEVSLAIAATVFPETLTPLIVAIAPSIELPLLILILRELELIKKIFFK